MRSTRRIGKDLCSNVGCAQLTQLQHDPILHCPGERGHTRREYSTTSWCACPRHQDPRCHNVLDGEVGTPYITQARLSQHLKDIRLILAAATAAGQALPLSETHRQWLEAAEAAGYGDADNSAVIRAFTGLR